MTNEELQQLQDRYNQWCQLLPTLEQSLEQWKQAEALLKPLIEFYGSDAWRHLYDHFDGPLNCQGNYSILSEDALWNALTEYHELCEEMAEQVVRPLSAQ